MVSHLQGMNSCLQCRLALTRRKPRRVDSRDDVQFKTTESFGKQQDKFGQKQHFSGSGHQAQSYDVDLQLGIMWQRGQPIKMGLLIGCLVSALGNEIPADGWWYETTVSQGYSTFHNAKDQTTIPRLFNSRFPGCQHTLDISTQENGVKSSTISTMKGYLEHSNLNTQAPMVIPRPSWGTNAAKGSSKFLTPGGGFHPSDELNSHVEHRQGLLPSKLIDSCRNQCNIAFHTFIMHSYCLFFIDGRFHIFLAYHAVKVDHLFQAEHLFQQKTIRFFPIKA